MAREDEAPKGTVAAVDATVPRRQSGVQLPRPHGLICHGDAAQAGFLSSGLRNGKGFPTSSAAIWTRAVASPWSPAPALDTPSLSSPKQPLEGAREHLGQVSPSSLGSRLPRGPSPSPPAAQRPCPALPALTPPAPAARALLCLQPPPRPAGSCPRAFTRLCPPPGPLLLPPSSWPQSHLLGPLSPSLLDTQRHLTLLPPPPVPSGV